jgi:hypothetical protein
VIDEVRADGIYEESKESDGTSGRFHSVSNGVDVGRRLFL